MLKLTFVFFQAVFYMIKLSGQKYKILGAKRVLKSKHEIKNIFDDFWRAFICRKLSQAWEWTFKGLPPIVVIWDHETNSKIYLCYLTTYDHQGSVTYCEFLHIKPHYPLIIQFYEHQTRQGSDLLWEAPTLEALFFDHVTNVEVMWQTLRSWDKLEKKCILIFTRLMVTKLGRVLTSDRSLRTQISKSSPTFCFELNRQDD